jgi:non-specific serine/threonine protein kinase
LLELRYVEALAPPAVRAQLGIEKSQYYREHARALAAVVALAGDLALPAAASDQQPVSAPDAGAPQPSPPGQPAGGLPRPLTSFVGREREVVAVRKRLLDPGVRLLTVTGPGGVGKTRLAFQAAAGAAGAFAHGVWFVALAPVRDPALVLPTVARVLGVTEATGQPLVETLAAQLRGRRLLLLLDNFEQVVAAAPCVVELLARCPTITALVTSREVLRVSGEHVWPTPPLTLPGRQTHPERTLPAPRAAALLQADAPRLFLQRARAVWPDLVVTEADAVAIVEICRRLDGLPLAVELAAARVPLLPPRALLARLGRCLPLLTGGARDVPEHQRTLRGTIGWSHDLLSPAEQRLFRRLAVFAGGSTPDAAEAVIRGDPAEPGVPDAEGPAPDGSVEGLEGLGSLVSKSLLELRAAPDEEPRYAMLETVREYALERLNASGEAPVLRDRHAAYYRALAERAAPELEGPRRAAWYVRLERELDNVRAALAWLTARGSASATGAVDAAQDGLRLASALFEVWMGGHPSEGRRWLAALLALPAAAGGTRARSTGLRTAGYLAFRGTSRPAGGCWTRV